MMNYAPVKRIEVSTIPVIDVAPLIHEAPGGEQAVASAFRRAAETIGFFYIKNHGVPQPLLDNAEKAAKAFFDLPLEQKLRVKISDRHRGFLQAGEAKMYDGARADLKESFVWGLDRAHAEEDAAPGDKLLGPNNWPDFMPELREALVPFFDAAVGCGRLIFRAFAASLNVDRDYFTQRYDRPVARGSIIYYPPQPSQMGEHQFGVAPHTDYGCMTLLHQGQVAGLQVRTRDGEWVTAHPIKGTLVVNVGDLLARWTNDRFMSTPHRVVNTSGKSRFSMGIFVDPNYETDVIPISGEGETPHYPTVTVGGHIVSRLDAAFAYRRDEPGSR